MHTESLPPSIRREKAINALIEIRACHGDIQTFVTGAFDRLDKLVDGLWDQKNAHEQVERRVERETMQEQIDQLARLATELAQSVAEHKQLTAQRDQAQPIEAET